MLQGKHITFIGLNFYPEDTAIGLYSTQMVDALIDAGAVVTIVTAVPYYPKWQIAPDYKSRPDYIKETYRTATVYRYKFYVPSEPTFKKRIRHILSFTRGAWVNLSKVPKAQLVISIIPFTSAAWLGNRFAARRKAAHWVHIQDFEFDAALQSGLSGASTITGLLFRQERKILNRATTVSTISHNMISRLKTKTSTTTYYLPNWIDGNQINPATAMVHPFLQDPRFKILYSGNVGEKQDWEFFLAFTKALPSKDFIIIIVGAGARYHQLKSQCNLSHVQFYDPVPFNQLSDLLCSTNAHILFQKTEVLDTVMPSKLLGMMASGKPSLVLGNAHSEVKTVMEAAHAGTYLTKPDVEAAIAQLKAWLKDPAKTAQYGIQARKYVISNFSRTGLLDKWVARLAAVL